MRMLARQEWLVGGQGMRQAVYVKNTVKHRFECQEILHSPRRILAKKLKKTLLPFYFNELAVLASILLYFIATNQIQL